MRKPHIYQAIKEENETYGYPISALCKLGKVSRAGYYKWLNRAVPANEGHNNLIADIIEKIHLKHPDKGYRRIRLNVIMTLMLMTNVYYASAAEKISNQQ